jgi:hypothetical protein
LSADLRFLVVFALETRLGALYDLAQYAGFPDPHRLIVDPAALARIPWELLFDPERRVFLGREGTIVRSLLATAAFRQPVQMNAPVRLLVVYPFPRGAPRVQDGVDAPGVARSLAPLERRRGAVQARVGRHSHEEHGADGVGAALPKPGPSRGRLRSSRWC